MEVLLIVYVAKQPELNTKSAGRKKSKAKKNWADCIAPFSLEPAHLLVDWVFEAIVFNR